MKGRLTAYAGYQLRDYFATRALPTLVASGLVAWALAAARGMTLSDLDPTGGIDARDRVQQTFELLLATFAFVAGAVAAHGVVSHHRMRGYDRLVFSRPVSTVRSYTQGFVLAGIGAVVIGRDGAEVSCYQAMVILGPVATSFNGKPGTPVLPLTDITITDCDFGTPRNAEQPWFTHNVKGLTLKNVRIAGKTISTVLDT